MVAPTGLIVTFIFDCRGGVSPPAKSAQNNREAKRLPYGHFFICRGGYYPPVIYKISLRFARVVEGADPYRFWWFPQFSACRGAFHMLPKRNGRILNPPLRF